MDDEPIDYDELDYDEHEGLMDADAAILSEEVFDILEQYTDDIDD